MKRNFAWFFCGLALLTGPIDVAAQSLDAGFRNPSATYRPYVWWHWMGSNFSLEGITKDLEAMKEAGIGGATIFNISSAVQESCAPTLNNPWPQQTYRSEAYWKALQHACSEAQRLGLELGIHNSVGYSTSGGPWIDEERGMKHLVWREVKIEGDRKVTFDIPRPDLPPYDGWGKSGQLVPSRYYEVALLAVAADSAVSGRRICDLSGCYLPDGRVRWKAPRGRWTVFRIGYAATMSRPHPVPDDLVGKALEVDKLDAVCSNYHWDKMLGPLQQYLGKYFGTAFRHVLIDSYEAGDQNWSRNFRDDFRKMKGYDPVPWLPYVLADGKDTLSGNKAFAERFRYDFQDVVARLYQTNSWQLGRDRVEAVGLKFQHEPYSGPFSTIAGAASADLPMGEFWTSGSGMIDNAVSAGARAAGHAVVGAEAFTSAPQMSRWTEDPAMLKPTTEGAFVSGVNHLVLHQWVHQAFDDRYQPGMSMGWWGTHFSRYQPWIRPGKAYFDYLGRCQYLLQQGEQVIDFLALDEAPDLVTDALVTSDFLTKTVKVVDGDVVLASGRRYRIMQFPMTGRMLPEVLDRLAWLVEQGATVVARKPAVSPSLSGYPRCDEVVRAKASELWNRFAGKRIFASREEAMQAIGLKPDYEVLEGGASVVHRRTAGTDIFYIGNLSGEKRHVAASLRIDGMLPELWNAETGDTGVVDHWICTDGRTRVSLDLEPYQSRFIVLRRKATLQETAQGAAEKPAARMVAEQNVGSRWTVHFEPKLDTAFDVVFDTLKDFSLSGEERIKYFTGTATYRTSFYLSAKNLGQSRIWLNLGEMNDIAELMVNGRKVGVLWYPPYRTDVTQYVHKGRNEIAVAVTDNWANRLIGDEQYPADFTWGADRGADMGRAMKAYPEWFINHTPRPQQGRKAFCVWYYYRKGSALQKAGLDGPVRLEFWKEDTKGK